MLHDHCSVLLLGSRPSDDTHFWVACKRLRLFVCEAPSAVQEDWCAVLRPCMSAGRPGSRSDHGGSLGAANPSPTRDARDVRYMLARRWLSGHRNDCRARSAAAVCRWAGEAGAEYWPSSVEPTSACRTSRCSASCSPAPTRPLHQSVDVDHTCQPPSATGPRRCRSALPAATDTRGLDGAAKRPARSSNAAEV